MKVIIIGGVAGGASCAARLRRLDENAEILMVERGPFMSYANCGLPYHISGTIAKEALALGEGLQSRAVQAAAHARLSQLMADRGALVGHVGGDRRDEADQFAGNHVQGVVQGWDQPGEGVHMELLRIDV